MLALCATYPTSAQQILSLDAVNSASDEQHPVIAPSGDLFFTVAFHLGSKDRGDVWKSVRSDHTLYGTPVKIAALSTSGYDVVVGFFDDQNILVYHDGKERKQGIHQYTLTENSWTYTGQLEIGSFRNQSSHFSGRLSSSGDILILSLQSFGSYGNEDIYVSFREDSGKWSSPQNLGPSINTYQQEMTPYLSEDTRLLFFSTNGHNGNGGLDIYYSERLDDTWESWSSPRPLTNGNTMGAELSYLPIGGNRDQALFTSTQNSEGYGDLQLMQTEELEIMTSAETLVEQSGNKAALPAGILSDEKVPLSEPASAVEQNELKQASVPDEVKKDTVKDESVKTQPKINRNDFLASAENPEGAVISLRVLDINSLEEIPFSIAAADSLDTISSMKRDAYKNGFPIDLESTKELTVTSLGYLPVSIRSSAFGQLEAPVLMTPVSKGLSMVLDDVLFKRGTAELLLESSTALIQRIANFLNENPTVRILLEGHTDNLGNAQLNKELSLDRASAIRKLLVDRGIAFERMRIAGWGGSRPISDNQTEEGRTKNRRVEMVIQ